MYANSSVFFQTMVKPNIDPKIFEKYGIKIAYLFGSRAKDLAPHFAGKVRGFAAPTSDFDIGVLFKEDGSDLLDKSFKLGSELQKYFPAEVDVRVLNGAPSLFRYKVISANLPLYAENEDERIDDENMPMLKELKASSLKKFKDDKKLRRIAERCLQINMQALLTSLRKK